MVPMRRMKILTWPTHPAYLHSLTQGPHEFYVLSRLGQPPGQVPVAANVHELPASEAKRQPLDCIVFQDDCGYLRDQHEFLSESQRRLPRIYVEHHPPCSHPVDEPHIVDARDVLVVHVTHFNRLMWNNGRTPTRVIEHGVVDPGYRYTGELARGLTVVHELTRSGRREGADIYSEVKRQVPLDLVARHAGPAFAAHYRFFFDPTRYASIDLALIERMMTGLPVIALATAEMVTLIKDGLNGHIDTDIAFLTRQMSELLVDKGRARQMGVEARRLAMARFNIQRFVQDWNGAFAAVTGPGAERRSAAA
jgi:hypothetical protein